MIADFRPSSCGPLIHARWTSYHPDVRQHPAPQPIERCRRLHGRTGLGGATPLRVPAHVSDRLRHPRHTGSRSYVISWYYAIERWVQFRPPPGSRTNRRWSLLSIIRPTRLKASSVTPSPRPTINFPAQPGGFGGWGWWWLFCPGGSGGGAMGRRPSGWGWGELVRGGHKRLDQRLWRFSRGRGSASWSYRPRSSSRRYRSSSQ